MADGRVTIVDLARETGVSVSSVSVALRGDPGVSEATRSRVLAAAERLGYRADRRARGLREQRPRVIGVTFWLHQTFHAALVDELYAAARPSGYDLVLSGTTADRPVAEAVESLQHERCGAMILISPDITRNRLARLGGHLPTVVVGSDVKARGVDLVRADDDLGMDLLVRHLVELGHERIAFVDGGDAVMSGSRRTGYERAMAAHGLTDGIDLVGGYPTEDAGVRAAHELVARPRRRRPTAVLMHNDMAAVGMLLTLRGLGVDVPGEMSVAGYDDTRIAGLATIALTTVSQDPRTLATESLGRAVARIEGSAADPRPLVVAPRLVVRSTTGPSPRGR